MIQQASRQKIGFILIVIMLMTLLMPTDVLAGSKDGYLVRGVGRTLFSVVEIPKAMIQDSQNVMFPFGLVTGVVKGTFKMIGKTLLGVGDIAYGALPYAKYAVFLV